MTRPGDSVEGITIPLGDPDALLGAGKQLQGAASQLEASSTQIAGMPSLLGHWAGPGSSSFATLTGHEALSVQDASRSVLMAGISVQISADQLADAQRKSQRAIVRARRARDDINDANEAIREAVQAQDHARGRMELATLARQAAELELLATAADALLGSGTAAAAINAADAAYRAAERDLHEAERREARARDRLREAKEDMRAARKDGEEAADDAMIAGVALQGALAMVPHGVLGMPGVPARPYFTDAAGIPRPVEPREIPLSEREPPEHWPGIAKSLFKIGRGEVTTFQAVAGLAEKAYENPEKIPGGLAGLGSSAYHDPIGTGKAVIGYDELAAGRYEDWLGQMGSGALFGGMGTVPSRAARMNRVAGSPRIQPVGRSTPQNAERFAGRRYDFRREDLGARPGMEAPKVDPDVRRELAQQYPKGVRFTRDGYPVFTPYAERRVVIEGMEGNRTDDFDKANAAIDRTSTPSGFTWHHVEDGRTMELVPKQLHETVRHTGGVPAAKNHNIGLVSPGGVFTPLEQRFAIGGGAAGGLAGGPAVTGAEP